MSGGGDRGAGPRDGGGGAEAEGSRAGGGGSRGAAERRVAGTGRARATDAAERLIRLHGEALLATARRYTVTPEDAEDAYQRGVEILLAKGPPVTEEELLPWTRTVVKHEAYAIWRGRDRDAARPDEEGLEHAPSVEPSPVEQVESYERLRMGAEAIGRLKPQEVRCLLLRAEGYSYRQICRITGWTYTKVNRCLTEGRRSFLQRLAGIESGAECDRLAPLISLLADGEATAGDMATLRPHLRSCLSCRATLRAYRDLPHRAAELVPVGGAAGADHFPAAFSRWLESVAAWAQERVALIGAKAQAATEAASASKVLAVAASTAAVAGGTVALRSLDDGEARAGPGVEESDHPVQILRRAALPGPLPRLPATADRPAVEPAAPVVEAPQVPPAPAAPAVPAAPTPPEPVPAPPPPAVAEPHVVGPPPASLPSDATIPVTDTGGESALSGVEEDERRIEPMTTPMERPAGRSMPQPAPPPEGEP